MDYIQEFKLFYKTLQQDDPRDVEKCIDFLNTLARSRIEKSPPLAECITIIKYDKPLLFSVLKSRLRNHPKFRLLFELHASYDHANQVLRPDV